MPEIPASRSTEELLLALDSKRVASARHAAFTVDDLSSMAMMNNLGEAFEIVQARFTGALPGIHSIGVREATTILGALQDVVSEVGAALRGESPKRGPLPSSILAETELLLSPQVSPGSVIFAMTPARDDALFEESTLLGDALNQVFDLFDHVERPASMNSTPESVAESLRRFGPRTARHLVRFAEALTVQSLNLDVGIARSGSRPTGSRISAPGARFLQSLAEKAAKRTIEVQILGEVQSLGTDHKYRVIDSERGKVTIKGSDPVTDILQVAFRRGPVRIEALETESINLATGAVSYSYVAVSAEVIDGSESGAGDTRSG